MPAVAVIQEGQALFIIVERKGHVGGFFIFCLNFVQIHKNLILD